MEIKKSIIGQFPADIGVHLSSSPCITLERRCKICGRKFLEIVDEEEYKNVLHKDRIVRLDDKICFNCKNKPFRSGFSDVRPELSDDEIRMIAESFEKIFKVLHKKWHKGIIRIKNVKGRL